MPSLLSAASHKLLEQPISPNGHARWAGIQNVRTVHSIQANGRAEFIVEARHVSMLNGKEDFPLVDTDFAMVWVDFHYPMGPYFRETLRQTCMTGVGFRENPGEE